MRFAVVALAALMGCAQVFGLEDTKLDKIDAALDAPGICDGAPQCTSLNGRSVCGQLVQTGAMAGVPLRVENPTGMPCLAGNMMGPCAFTVFGQPRADFLANTTNGRKDAVIDDCGRYAVIDFDSAQADVAIVITGDAMIYKRTAALLIGRPTIAGPGNVDRGVDALVITKATALDWAMQVMPSGTPPDTATGIIARYLRQGRPLANVKVAKDNGGAFTNMPGVLPWAAYFAGGSGFATIDPMLQETAAVGGAFAVMGGGAFSLVGITSGSRCQLDGLGQVDNTLIYVNVPRC